MQYLYEILKNGDLHSVALGLEMSAMFITLWAVWLIVYMRAKTKCLQLSQMEREKTVI